MFTTPLRLPSSFQEFLSPQSPLNPHFFAYGNFPLYLLKLLGELSATVNPLLNDYGGIHLVGRLISAVADTATVFVVFLIGSRLLKKRGGLFASALYACSVFPVQAAHFYAVDSLLTFFITSAIFVLILYIKDPSYKKSVLIGLFVGLALATKVSSAILLAMVFIVLLYAFLSTKKRVSTLIHSLAIVLVVGFVFVATQPYTIIDMRSFIQQTTLQGQMSNNAFLFPYTLQYVGKIPYLYEGYNIAFWGLGPIISSFCIAGIGIAAYRLYKKGIFKNPQLSFLIFFLVFYFLLFGKFAVGWMRYMLPIYPVLTIFGAFTLNELANKYFARKILHKFTKIALFGFFIVIIMYPLSFISIYTKPNTRIQASDWMLKNIPLGSYLAIEHWDDSLPVYGGENFIHLTLPLYDPDNPEKWRQIESTLNIADYIVIASNRLYVPLQRLTDCNVLPKDKCYPKTAQYYKNLFSGKLGFEKVAEFSSYPTIPLANIKIQDDAADESFTVYDHPKIFIFKRIDLAKPSN